MYRIRTNQLRTMKATEKKYMHLNTYKTAYLFFFTCLVLIFFLWVYSINLENFKYNKVERKRSRTYGLYSVCCARLFQNLERQTKVLSLVFYVPY